MSQEKRSTPEYDQAHQESLSAATSARIYGVRLTGHRSLEGYFPIGSTSSDTPPLQQLRRAILAQQQILEQLGELVLELSKSNRTVLELVEEQLLRGFEPDAAAGEERLAYSEPGEELLSIPEVRQRLGMGKSWVYQRLKSGELPSVRLGGNFKVRRQDLEEYIRKNRRNQAAG